MGITIEDLREMRANGITNVEINHIKQLYEARLRADMVAMLTEIQMEIDELWEITWKSDYKGGYKDGCVKANELIQQKINALKGEEK